MILDHGLLDQGLALPYVAEANVIHLHSETPRGVYNRYRREAMAFKRLFPEQRFSLVDFTQLVVRNIASDPPAGGAPEIPEQIPGRDRIVPLDAILGTYQGYRGPGGNPLQHF